MTMAIETDEKSSGIDGALRWIGDLDHPFYQDERQRFVWYEASAIGMQLVLLLQFLIGGGVILIFGLDAVWIGLATLLPGVIASSAVMFYANRRGTMYFAGGNDLRRSRGVFGILVTLVFVGGLVRLGVDLAGDEGVANSGFLPGVLAGGFAAGLWIGFAKRAERKREASAADVD